MASLVLGISLVTWWLFGPSSAPVQTRAGAEEGAEQRSVRCEFHDGQRLEYRWTLDLEFRADTGSSRGMARLLDLGVSGSMDWRVVAGPDGADGGWTVGVRVHDLSGTEAGRSALWTPAMDAPFLVRVRPDCGFEGYGFPKALAPHDGNTLVGLLQSMEVALGRKGGETSWSRRQFDARGASMWDYEQGEVSDAAVELKRRRLSYSRLWAEDKGVTLNVSRSEGSVSMSGDGAWLVRSRIAETLRTRDASGPVSREKIDISLFREDRKASPLDTWVYDPNGYVWREASSPPAKAPSIRRSRQLPARLADAKVADLMAEILSLLASDQSSVRKEGLRLLESWLRERPEGAAALVQWMRELHIPLAGQAPLWLALERAGTPESIAVIKAAITDKSLGGVSQVRAIGAYVDAAPPDADSVRFIMETSRPWEGLKGSEELGVAGSVTMAMGAMESRFQSGHADLAETLHAEVVGRLASATNEHEIRALIEAVGNSGDESYLEQLTVKLADEDRLTRRVAARALRRMDAGEIQDLVSEGLGAESDAKVKVSLAKSYLQSVEEAEGEVDPVVVIAVIGQLNLDQTPKLRAQLIRILGAAVSTNPAAKAALIAHFALETEPGLLKLIGQFVSAADL